MHSRKCLKISRVFRLLHDNGVIEAIILILARSYHEFLERLGSRHHHSIDHDASISGASIAWENNDVRSVDGGNSAKERRFDRKRKKGFNFMVSS